MKRLSSIFLTLGLVLLMLPAFGQQDPQYSMYMFNAMAVNPAYAGSRDGLSATFLLRRQWVGIEGAPNTESIAVHAPSRNERHGFGASVTFDRLGITRQSFVSANYAFRFPLGPGRLALGLRGGITQFQNRWSEIQTTDPNDVANPGINSSVLLPRFGTGVYYDTERFYLGASAPNLLSNTYNLENAPVQGYQAQQRNHYFFTTGVVIPLGESLDFKPSVLAKFVQNAPLEFDLNASLLIKKAFWIGASYRTGDAILFMAQYVHNNRFSIGYAYDYTLTDLSNFNSGSHEIMLGVDLGGGRKKIITPRYF